MILYGILFVSTWESHSLVCENTKTTERSKICPQQTGRETRGSYWMQVNSWVMCIQAHTCRSFMLIHNRQCSMWLTLNIWQSCMRLTAHLLSLWAEPGLSLSCPQSILGQEKNAELLKASKHLWWIMYSVKKNKHKTQQPNFYEKRTSQTGN